MAPLCPAQQAHYEPSKSNAAFCGNHEKTRNRKMRRAEITKHLLPDKSIVMLFATLTIMNVAFQLVNGSHVSGKILACLTGTKWPYPGGRHSVMFFWVF